MMIEEGSTKIANFLTAGVGVLLLRRDHISYTVKINYFIKTFFSTLRHISDKQVVQYDVQGKVQKSKLF